MQLVSAPGAASITRMRTHSQNSENPSSLTRKSVMFRKGEQINRVSTGVRAASGLQRGSTTEATPQSHPKVRSGDMLRCWSQSPSPVVSHSAVVRNGFLQGTELYKRRQMQPPFPIEMKNKHQRFSSSFNDAVSSSHLMRRNHWTLQKKLLEKTDALQQTNPNKPYIPS